MNQNHHDETARLRQYGPARISSQYEPPGTSLSQGCSEEQARSWIIASATALVAGASAFTANLDTLVSRAKAFREERAYFATLQNPFPDLLDRSAISDWRSGRVQLALYQIDGYHGVLKTAPAWIKVCLTNSEIFPGLADRQFNDRRELPESYVDQQNKQILSQRLDQIDNDQSEDAATLRINDPFTRLLTRSRYQLLSKYKDSELPQLDKAELYLLRNAIYARHGYPFNTKTGNCQPNGGGQDHREAASGFRRLRFATRFFFSSFIPIRNWARLAVES
jgi:hypothetical protein